MKTALETARTREYPHLVTTNGRRPLRTTIIVANEPLANHPSDTPLTFIGVGMLDRHDRLTPGGRRTVLDARTAATRRSGLEQCVVWGRNDCSWIDRNGCVREGSRPPIAVDTRDPYLYEDMPLVSENCWTVEIPGGNDPTHLCIRSIDRLRIEICPGERIVLGSFDEPMPAGERDPCARLLDADGRLAPPPVWRGLRVTGVDGWSILGPVQPFDDGVVLREPTPDRLRDACEAVAGCRLDDAVFERCWRAARPEIDFMPVGVLEAA